MTTPDHWPPDAIPEQTGRTILITGATTGIGLQTAKVRAAHGARLIFSGRTRSKLDKAVREIHTSLSGTRRNRANDSRETRTDTGKTGGQTHQTAGTPSAGPNQATSTPPP
jgi:NAD(P)-dependent dehydrogenase (short-subunit alcohol dehydrogenase family)